MMPTELPSRKSVLNPKAWPGFNPEDHHSAHLWRRKKARDSCKTLHVLFPRTKEGEESWKTTKAELVYCPAEPGIAILQVPFLGGPGPASEAEITDDEVAEAAKDMSDILANHGIEERVVILQRKEGQ